MQLHRLMRLSLFALFGGLALATAQIDNRAHATTTAAPPSQVATTQALPTQQAPLASAFSDQGLTKTSALPPVLDKLVRIDAQARTQNRQVTASALDLLPDDVRAMTAARILRIDEAGRVLVLVGTKIRPSDALHEIPSDGVRIERVDDRLQVLQALVPIPMLTSVAAASSVVTVDLPEPSTIQTGSVTTQGDTILNAASLRSSLGVTGRATRVGVISDGLEGLAASQASGDLPSTVNASTCNVVAASPPNPQPLPTDVGAGGEGTAMLEIVHDIAPDAELWFGYFGNNLQQAGTSLDFEAAVNCLAQNVDIVVDDVGWFNVGPYDGTNAVSANTSAALNNPSNRIRGYYTAVGNQALSHYQSSYVNSGYYVGSQAGDFWTLNQFQGSPADPANALACAANVYCGDTVTINPNGIMIVLLEWNDPFANSSSDYDLLVRDTFGSPALYLENPVRQNGTGQQPTEEFAIQNTHGVVVDYNILIGNYKGLAPSRTLNMFILCSGCSASNYGGRLHDFNTTAGSMPNESDAGSGVLSLGAISATDAGNADIEPYSSNGPTADGRTKPDIAAIDCVTVTGNGSIKPPFCGTSAAAPHAAAVAALTLSCNPALLASATTGAVSPTTARSTLATALENGAVPLGAGVPNNTFGYGRVNTTGTAPLANCRDTDGDGWPDGMEIAASKNASSYCGIMRADVNLDGAANLLDMALVAHDFLQAVPPAAARFDQNGDGKINMLDLALQGHYFAQSVSSCP